MEKAVANKSNKTFPWFYSGLLLLGFSLGVFITTGVDIMSRVINLSEEETSDITEADKCRDEGGRYDTDEKKCILTSGDVGDQCSSNDDCEGWCIASSDAQIGDEQSGTCSKEFRFKGCIKFIDDGKVNEVCLPE